MSEAKLTEQLIILNLIIVINSWELATIIEKFFL